MCSSELAISPCFPRFWRRTLLFQPRFYGINGVNPYIQIKMMILSLLQDHYSIINFRASIDLRKIDCSLWQRPMHDNDDFFNRQDDFVAVCRKLLNCFIKVNAIQAAQIKRQIFGDMRIGRTLVVFIIVKIQPSGQISGQKVGRLDAGIHRNRVECLLDRNEPLFFFII